MRMLYVNLVVPIRTENRRQGMCAVERKNKSYFGVSYFPLFYEFSV